MEENDRIVRQLENKIARLDNILNSYLPTDHMKYEAHKRRVYCEKFPAINSF